MVLAHELERWFERRRKRRDARVRAEVLAEGRTEERVESNRRWRGWLERKNLADAKGEPFDEPPPDIDQNGTNGS